MAEIEIGLQPETSLRVLYTGDLHGNVEKMKYISTVIKQARFEKKICLLLDSGDWSKGDSLCDRFNGEPMAQIMNYLKYDALCLGEGELSWGVRGLKRLFKILKSPFLSSNLVGETQENIKPYIIKEFQKFRVAIMGVSPVVILKERHYSVIAPEEGINKSLSELNNQNVDFIILLSHCGIEKDREFAGAFSSINLIVGGHSHIQTDNAEKIGDTMIVHGGAFGEYLGKLDIDIGAILTVKEK